MTNDQLNELDRCLRRHLSLMSDLGDAWAKVIAACANRHPVQGAAKIPKGLKRGEQGMCFTNCARAAADSGLLYVEGYAVSLRLLIPIHHAWLLGPDGRAVDLTWKDPAMCAYVGVAFRPGKLWQILGDLETFGLMYKHPPRSMRLTASQYAERVAAAAEPGRQM